MAPLLPKMILKALSENREVTVTRFRGVYGDAFVLNNDVHVEVKHMETLIKDMRSNVQKHQNDVGDAEDEIKWHRRKIAEHESRIVHLVTDIPVMKNQIQETDNFFMFVMDPIGNKEQTFESECLLISDRQGYDSSANDHQFQASCSHDCQSTDPQAVARQKNDNADDQEDSKYLKLLLKFCTRNKKTELERYSKLKAWNAAPLRKKLAKPRILLWTSAARYLTKKGFNTSKNSVRNDVFKLCRKSIAHLKLLGATPEEAKLFHKLFK